MRKKYRYTRRRLKKSEWQEIRLEDNKGYDIFEIEKLADNNIELYVGSDGISVINCIMPVSALVGILTHASIENNGIKGAIKKAFAGNKEWSDELVAKTIRLGYIFDEEE